MKRFACLAAFLPLLLAPVSGQVKFYDDFQNAELNRFLVGDLNAEWTLYNDENKPSTSPDLTYIDQAWKIIRHSNGEMTAASLSLFTASKAADRWMITPAVDLGQAQKPVLSFRAKAIDPNTRDGFEVKISVDGVQKEDFKVSLENVSRCRGIWTYYHIDLSEYKGKTIHVAFIQNSKEQYILAIDDVAIYDKESVAALMNGFTAPFTVMAKGNASSVNAYAQLFNAGEETITSYTLCRQVDGGQVEKTEVSGTNIEAGATFDINASFNLGSTGFHTLSLWVEKINGTDVSSPKTDIGVFSANTDKLPRKNMLLEMFSSGMCTACAPWNRDLHPFFITERANVADNGGNFCVAKYQINIPAAGDPCVTDQTLARGDFYNLPAAPSFYVNGTHLPLSDTGTIHTALRDSIANAARTTVPTGLIAYLERENNTFKVHAEVTSYLPDPNDYRLVVCILEDSIHHTRSMHNGETDFYNVTRQMLTGVTGIAVETDQLGKTVSKDFEYTFDLVEPKIFSSVENMSAVVFLQNARNREVVQARYLAQGYRDSSVSVNNTAPERLQRQLRVYPNPATQYCMVRFTAPAPSQARLEILDMQGKAAISKDIRLEEGDNLLELDTQKLASGLYIVRISSPQGVFVNKLLKQ